MGQILGGPKLPKPDPEIERRRKEEEARAEEEKQREIQKQLRRETALSTSGQSKSSLFSAGRSGFARSLLGGGVSS